MASEIISGALHIAIAIFLREICQRKPRRELEHRDINAEPFKRTALSGQRLMGEIAESIGSESAPALESDATRRSQVWRLPVQV
jgi:hypothetical protein